MMDLYFILLAVSMIAAAIITYFTRFHDASGESKPSPAGFLSFQNTYLLAYVFAFFGDWLQGPYVYALYSSYGFEQRDIAVLFVAGFGSSMIFGTFVGSLADKMGRKKFALMYCAFYIASCCTKHFKDYWMLMLGRVLGGVATSLLFSVFESWMVAEHNARGFEGSLLSDTFSKAMFANSLVAILSGFIANYFADMQPLTESTMPGVYFGGNTAPFDVAIFCLALCCIFVFSKWGENYGAQGENVTASSGLSLDALKEGMETIRNNSKIFIIGSVASLFEGSMYTFVFLWTPLLQAADRKDLPFGVIFAVLMLSCMSGSQIFGFLIKRMEPAILAQRMFVVAACSLLVPALTSSKVAMMVAFMVFEVCVGIYWPCVGTLKGIYVPEQQRSAIYNLFRIPLNAIVLFVLLSKVESQTSFLCCGVLMLIGAYLLGQLHKLIKVSSTTVPAEEAQALTDTAPETEMV